MTRLCVIGDSHAGGMKRAWSKLNEHFPGTELEFLVAATDGLSDLVVSGNALVAGSEVLEQALRRVRCPARIENDFDGFILCGLGLVAKSAIVISRRYRARDFTADSRAPISDDCFVSAIADAHNLSLMGATLTKPRTMSHAPILVIGTPFRSVNSEGVGGKGFKPTEDDRALAPLFHEACKLFAGKFNAGYLPQPGATLGDNVLTTRHIFASRTGPRLNPDGPREDNVHMNIAYSAIVLGQALKLMTGKDPGAGWDDVVKHLTIAGPRATSADATRKEDAMAAAKPAATKEKSKEFSGKKHAQPGSEIADLAALIAGMNKVMSHLQSVASAANGSIHVTDWLLLHSLTEENNLPMAQAARRIGVSRQRVHQQVESLKRANLLEGDDSGGKNKPLSISAAGRDLVQRMEAELGKALSAVEGTMPSDKLLGAKRSILRLGKAILPKPQKAEATS